MTEASNIAHSLLLRHAATPAHQLALPVDPAAIARAEGIDVPSVGDAYGRWDSALTSSPRLKAGDSYSASLMGHRGSVGSRFAGDGVVVGRGQPPSHIASTGV